MIEIDELREFLSYDPVTGIVRWKRSKSTKHMQGSIAGNLANTGHLKIGFNRKTLQLHRVCWAIYYEEWPSTHIDHINGIRHDNRICNLRLATTAQNSQNRNSPQKNNSSGHLGVTFSKGKYLAQISVNRKRLFLGSYETPELASAAYLEAKRKYHEFNTL